jgi:hypothetical protein
MREQLFNDENDPDPLPTPGISSRAFCLTVAGIAVVMNLALVLSAIVDAFPRGRESLQGAGAVASAFFVAPLLNGLLMLVSVGVAMTAEFSGSRSSCVRVAVIAPLVGVVINLVVVLEILPAGGPGIFEGAH